MEKYKSEFNPIKDIYAKGIVDGFTEGYKAAQSDKQFSLEDMKKAFQAGTQSGYEFCDLEHYYNEQESQLPDEEIPDEDEEFEEFIQSLSTQQLPVSFEPEYENHIKTNNDIGHVFIEPKPKTITNSEGKIVLVGTYKY